jgi:hypothetical protein
LLADGHQAGQHPRRGGQLAEVGGEGEERPEADRARDRQPPAEGEDRDLPQGGDRLEGRLVLGLDPHGAHAAREQPPCGARELAELVLLLAEALHDAHPGHGLVDHAGDDPRLLLCIPRRREHRRPQLQRHVEQQRTDRQRDQRQQRREDQHHDQRQDEQQDVAGDDREERQQALDEVDVGARSADELPGLHRVVAGEVEPLQLLVDRPADVVLHVETHPSADEAPHVGAEEADHSGDEQEREPRRQRPSLGDHDVVDDHLLDERCERGDRRADHRRPEGDGDVAAVRVQEARQTADPTSP